MQYLEQFIASLFTSHPGMSNVTRKNYRADVKKFIDWMVARKGAFEPESVTREDIESFTSFILQQASAASVNRYRSSLKLFFTYLTNAHITASNPCVKEIAENQAEQDPYQLQAFKNHLFIGKSSHLTIKNYIIDVKQYLAWHEENASSYGSVSEATQAYHMYLQGAHSFSPASINRKVSAVKRYLSWLDDHAEGATPTLSHAYTPVRIIPMNTPVEEKVELSSQRLSSTHLSQLLDAAQKARHDKKNEVISHKENHAYSPFPPFRLAQKITRMFGLMLEHSVVTPLVHTTRNLKRKTMNARDLFVERMQTEPLTLPWYSRAFYHALYTRPAWYRSWQKTAVSQYFNMLVLLVFAAVIGVGFYVSFIQKTGQGLAAGAAPLRILSFQGRLTDTNDNPFTGTKNVRFIIYNSASATGSARLWEEVRSVSLDSDGIFSVLLGSDGSGGQAALCNGNNPPSSPATGSCGIMQTLFSNNNQLWLGVTIENTPELTPRQQLATVSYASNAETLQGLPPTTDTTNVTSNANAVLALNSSGTVDIQGTATPTTIQYTGNQLNLVGKVLALETAPGTNTNVQLIPDGLGQIDLQKPIQNSSLNGNAKSASTGLYTDLGAVEIQDIAAIIATSSGQSALTIDQESTGPLISASTSGTAKFTVDSSGNTTAAGNGLFSGNLTTGGNLVLSNSSGTTTFGGIAYTWPTGGQVNGYSLVTNGSGTLSWSPAAGNYWQRVLGALSPLNITDDLLLGANSTTSANLKFGFLNVAGGTPTATISGNFSLKVPTGTNPAETINVLNGGTLGVYTSVGGDAGLTANPALYVNNAGQVGVHTTSINGAFEISASGAYTNTEWNSTNAFEASTGHTTSDYAIYLGADKTNNLSYIQSVNVGNTVAPIILNGRGGAVGINTATFANPNTELQVADTAATDQQPIVVFGDGSDSNRYQFLADRGGGSVFLMGSGAGSVRTYGSLSFQNNATTNMYIASNGSVGINTTSLLTNTGLEVYRDSGGNATLVVDNRNATNVGDLLTASASGVSKFTVNNSGAITSAAYTSAGGIFYGTSTGLIQEMNGTATAGLCLVSGSSAAPTWSSCSAAASNYWTLTSPGNGAITPTNSTWDFLLGGNATSSAKFAVLNMNTGTPVASISAVGSGTGIVLGGDGTIQATQMNNLLLGGAASGGVGTGDIILSPRNGGAGSKVTFNANTLALGGTNTLITNTGSNTLTLNSGSTGNLNFFTSSNYLTSAGNLFLNGTLAVNQGGASSTMTNIDSNGNVLPGTNFGANLGSPSLNWNNIYAQNIIIPPSGTISGFWQMNNNVLAPTYPASDLAIGGNATGSAFQVFALPHPVGTFTIPAGTASTSGNLTFTGSGTRVDMLNNDTLGFYNGNTGFGLTPSLFLNSNGYVGLGTTNPTASPLQVNYDSNTVPDLYLGTGANTANFLSISGGRAMFGYDGSTTSIGAGASHGLGFYVNGTANVFPTGTEAMYINSAGNVGVGTTKPNALFNEVSTATTTTTASISATADTTGDILSVVPPNPSTSFTGNVINASSATHTYMSLNNQDLTIGGHKNITSISNVVKVFIYDTTKDSDGGAWTNDERAQGSSWYDETLNTATRGSTRPFPKKAILVATTTNLYIYDAKDNSLWMQFNKAASTQMIGDTGTVGSAVFALNGKIYYGMNNGGASGAVNVIDFKNDSAYRYTNVYAVGNKNILNRNTTVTFSTLPNITAIINRNYINDIYVNVVNGQTYMAIANNGGSKGGVELINESNQSLVGRFGPGQNVTNVWLTSVGDLYGLVSNGGTPANYAIKIKRNAVSVSSGDNQLYDEVYYNIDSTHYGATTTDSNTFSSINGGATNSGPASSSATFVPSSLYVTEGTSTVDGVSNTIYVGAQGSSGSLMVFQEKRGDPNNSSVKYYNKNYITDEMVGSTRGYWPLTEASGNVSDVTTLGNTLTANGTLTYSVSGVRNTGITFNGSTGYFSCANATCVTSSKLNPQGNTLTLGAWIKTSSVTQQMIISAYNSGVSGSYYLSVNGSGLATFHTELTPFTDLTSTRNVADGNWHYVVGTYDGSNMRIYVDGQLDGTIARTGNLPSTTANFAIGADYTSGSAANFFNGTIDQPFVAASTLTSSEIAHQYQVGYRALQNHASQSIRGVTIAADASQEVAGGNSNVSAVAASIRNGMIYIGTNPGGISAIGMDTDTIQDYYSPSMTTQDDTGQIWGANNGFVNTISVGQSYGTGTLYAFGSNNSGAGGVWMESQDTTFKDFLASNYNPFGSTLSQSNLSVDSVLRVTNQLSTRLDNMATNATSSAALADVFRVDNNGNLLSRSLVNSSTAMQFQDASGNNIFVVDTAGNGVKASRFVDINNAAGQYYLAPAAVGYSLLTAGSIGIKTLTPQQALTLGGGNNMAIEMVIPQSPSAALAAGGSLTVGTTYYYKITALDGVGETAGSVEVSATPTTGNQTINLSWTSSTAATSYNVYRTTTSGSYGATSYLTTVNTNSASDTGGTALTSGTPPTVTTAYVAKVTASGNSWFNGGSLGIGTTNPDEKLSVFGSIKAEGISNPRLVIDSNAVGAHQYEWYGNAQGVAADLGLYDRTASAYRMYIQGSTGNVGIGTTSPGALLTVGANYGGTAFSTSFKVDAGALGGTAGNYVIAGSLGGTSTNASALGIRLYREANGTDWTTTGIQLGYDVDNTLNAGAYIELSHSGNIGMGTTTPAQMLEVHGMISGSEGLPSGCSTQSGGFSFYQDGCQDTGMFSNSDGDLRLYANNTLVHQINNSHDAMYGANQLGRLSILNTGGNRTNTESGDNAFLYQFSNSGNYLAMYGGAMNYGGYIQTSQAGVGTGSTYLLLQYRGGHVQGGSNCFNLSGGSVGVFCSDYAEYYQSNSIMEAADIVVPDTTSTDSAHYVTTTTKPYDPAVIGIVSTTPAVVIDDGAFMMGNGNIPIAPTTKPPVATAGRIPVKFISTNGFVHVGDSITSAGYAGFGMKATQAGPVVGKVIEDFDPSNGEMGRGLMDCPTGAPAGAVCGKVMVLLTVSWHDPDVYLTDTGNLNIVGASGSALPYQLLRTDGSIDTRIGEFGQAVIAILKAGMISTQDLTTNTLSVATSNVTIAGQNIQDFIVTTVQAAINNGTITAVSPLPVAEQLHANVISPLAQDSHIAVTLTNSTLSIHANESSTSATVASIDNQGNASFSGTLASNGLVVNNTATIAGALNSQNLAVNGDATISGTLHADRIEANSIVGLQAILSTMSAQNITNVNSIAFATPTGTLADSNSSNSANLSSATPSGLLTPYLGYTNLASYSGFLAYVPQIQATTAVFTQGLQSAGNTTLADTEIAGQLAVNSTLILADNSISTIGNDLQIQPMAQANVLFEGGQIAFDTNGNLTMNGNAVIKQTLFAHAISPLPGQDLSIQLGDTNTGSNSALMVHNASGSAVFQLSQIGDIIASGTATIGKLNLSIAGQAYALSETEVIATGSAGTTQINAYQKQVTIDNPAVTPNSLIYITPVGTASAVTPVLIRQQPGQSFSVGIPAIQDQPTQFNWLIVN